jgi:hypothetical protein
LLTGKRRFQLAEHVLRVSGDEMGSPAGNSDDMQIRKRSIAPLLLAAGAAAVIAVAPTATAATTTTAPVFPHDHTTLVGPLPGDSEINACPPVSFAPQYPYWEGDYFGGGYGRGGFGGGFGGHGGGGHR